MAGLLDFLSGSGGDPSKDPTGGGLMGMFANPQTAGLLGMSQGLLSAAGPSRIPVSMGQAMGQGLQGLQQGAGNALQMRMQMARMQNLMDPFGTLGVSQNAQAQPQQQAQPNPAMAQGAPVMGAANVGSLSGPSAGMGGLMQPQAQAQPAAAGAAPGGPLIMGHTPAEVMVAGYRAAALGNPAGTEMMKMAAQYDPTLAMQMPTDIQKNAAAAYGYGTPEYQSALQGIVGKDTYLSLRPGAPYVHNGVVQGTPGPAPSGYMNLPDSSSPTGWSQVAVPGGSAAVKNSAAASAIGKAYGDNTAGVDTTTGKPVYVNQGALADTLTGGGPGAASVPLPLRNNNPGAVSPGGGPVASYPDMATGLKKMDDNLASYASDPKVKTVGDTITKWVGSAPNAPAYIADVTSRLGVPANTPVDLTNPVQRQALGTAIALHESGPHAVFGAAPSGNAQPGSAPSVAPAMPPGYNQGQQDLQADLTKKWGAVNQANSQAQTTVSYLQNIRDLAQKAATGPQSDRLNFVNGLLSLAGSERATDTVTANDLLNKYSNQIVSRLGSGDLGTDAARSILASAYPNAHMTAPAINEAVDNLVGASQMTQAKYRLLQGDYNARNPQSYTQKEGVFDQNADPRIWQFQNMNPAQRQQFKANMAPADQKTFSAKIRTLEGLGALQ